MGAQRARLLVLAALSLLAPCNAWCNWTKPWPEFESQKAKQTASTLVARQGHSMVLYETNTITRVIVFGGRSNNGIVEHRPKSFEIISQKGKLKRAK